MLTINDEKIKIKKAEMNFKIVNNIKKAYIAIETYLGIFNERMDSIFFDIEINRVQEITIQDLEGAIFHPYNLKIKKIYTETWRDIKIKDAELKINSVNGNMLNITLEIEGKNNYYIDTEIEAVWFIGKANLTVEKNLQLIDQYHSIEDINHIPFIEEDKNKTIKFTFEKQKENIIWR